MKSLNEIFSCREGQDYQRDNFDAFLKKIKFKYHTPSIHVAGTNGKGSTCYYLDNVYRHNGYKVGRFISPALVNVNECITVNGVEISDEEIKSIVSNNEKLIKKYHLSSFELLTYIALTYFDKEACDIAIIECGMGGEIDATNVFDPILSIITSVSLEHTEFLGKTISEVALHKAGIIKNNVPLITKELEDDAKNTIYRVAKEVDAPIYLLVNEEKIDFRLGISSFNYRHYHNVRLGHETFYERINAMFALEASIVLQDNFLVDIDKVKEGIAQTFIPCRLEKIKDEPLIFVDGAHNPEAMKSLAKSIVYNAKGKHISIVFASFKDKNLMSMLSSIGVVASEICLTTFDHVRARNYEDYYLFGEEYPFFASPIEAVKSIKEKHPENLILITGSLAFASYMKELLKDEQI